MKIALITDQHFGIRNDSVQFHNYYEKFYKEIFFPTLEKHGIKDIIELGDIFDRRKYINFDSLSRCRDYFFGPIYSAGINLHCIVGNHDTYFKNTNSVNAPKLLLGWMDNGLDYDFDNGANLSIYQEASADIEFDGRKILFMPWINSSNYDSAMDKIENSNADVCMGHLELRGFEMYKGASVDAGISHTLFKKFDMVMSGHFHHKSSKDNVHYLGSPYQMTWSDYDDDRGFHIFDTETLELTYVKNPFIMFHKVFFDDVEVDDIPDFSHLKDTYVKVVVKNKNNPYVFDLFMDKLNACEPVHVQVVEDNLNLDIGDESDFIDEAEDTMTIVKKYVEGLSLSESQTKNISSMFNDLYQEVLSND